MKLKVQLESENEEMYRLLNDVEGSIQKIAEEVIRKQEKKWKEAMSEVIENSKLEIKGAHDQLIAMKQEHDRVRVLYEEAQKQVEAMARGSEEREVEMGRLKEENA